MMGLSDGRKNVRIGLAVLIQYRSVMDTHPATQPASHVAVAITLNAQASSLKTLDDFRNNWSMRIVIMHSKRTYYGQMTM